MYTEYIYLYSIHTYTEYNIHYSIFYRILNTYTQYTYRIPYTEYIHVYTIYIHYTIYNILYAIYSIPYTIM